MSAAFGISMKRRGFKILLVGVVVAIVATVTLLFLALRNPGRISASVSFLCYTNKDAQGHDSNHKFAWYEIENKGRFALDCRMGRITTREGSEWTENTNYWGYQYPTVMPGESRVLDFVAPKQGEQLRASFLVSNLILESEKKQMLRYRIRRFVEGLGLERIGVRVPPERARHVEIVAKDVELLFSETQ